MPSIRDPAGCADSLQLRDDVSTPRRCKYEDVNPKTLQRQVIDTFRSVSHCKTWLNSVYSESSGSNFNCNPNFYVSKVTHFREMFTRCQ